MRDFGVATTQSKINKGFETATLSRLPACEIRPMGGFLLSLCKPLKTWSLLLKWPVLEVPVLGRPQRNSSCFRLLEVEFRKRRLTAYFRNPVFLIWINPTEDYRNCRWLGLVPILESGGSLKFLPSPPKEPQLQLWLVASLALLLHMVLRFWHN